MSEKVFIPAPFFLLRIPIWPIEKYTSILFNRELESTVEFYDTNEQLREAIAIASPSLHRSLKKRSVKKITQEAKSLSYYITRMITRATPFGLFSCVSTGGWGETTNILFDSTLLRKRARCDMEWIYLLTQKLYEEENLFPLLTVHTNPLIQLSGERYYLNYVRHTEKKEASQAISIRATHLINQLFDLAKEPIKIASLWSKIEEKLPHLKQEKMLMVMRQLLSQQFLLPSILPSLFNPLSLESLLPHLNFLPSIQSIVDEIQAYNQLPPGHGESIIEKLQDNMSAIASSKTYLQVDTVHERHHGHLSKKVLLELEKAVAILWKMSSLQNKRSLLMTYHEKFIEKYGEHRTIPLLELLDEEKGLGSSFENHSSLSLSSQSFDPLWEKWLHDQWQHCLFHRKKEWVMTEDMLNPFLLHAKQPDPLATHSSFDVFCKVFADSHEAIDQDNFLLMLFETTQEGGSVFGRFLDILGTETQSKLSQFFHQEEQLEPQSIFVELSYWPATVRSANVKIRPSLRKYRLDIDTNEIQPGSLSLEDIYVGATSSRFYLTDREGKYEIITRTGNLLNVFYAPPPIKFMRYVTLSQFQTVSPFVWGETQKKATFLPRVRFGKTILSPAQWNLDSFLMQKGSLEQNMSLFNEWANQWELPESFFIVRGDQHLLLDRRNHNHLHDIVLKLKNGESLTFIENINGAWIKGDEGHHFCEISVPFVKNSQYIRKEKPFHPLAYHSIANEDRYKFPGSDWLYLKIYLAEEKINEFLVRHLHPLAQQLHQQEKIIKWFMIRYRDPDSHLRFRLHLNHPEINNKIFALLEETLRMWMDVGLIKDISLTKYEREVERYGGPLLIHSSEMVFYYDTLATCSILESVLLKRIKTKEKILHALCVVNFLRSCGLSEDQILSFLNQSSLDESELKGFREHKNELMTLLTVLNENDGANSNSDIEWIKVATHMISTGMDHFRAQAKDLDEKKLYGIFDSMLHMHCNRLGCVGRAEIQARLYARQALLSFHSKGKQKT